MKRVIMAIVLITGIFIIAMAQAGAETYIVKPNDRLETIAQRHGLTWRDLGQANSQLIKNPNRIMPGWKLTIPEKGAELPAKAIKQTRTNSRDPSTTAENFSWKNPGANPFGKRNKIRAVTLSGWPADVREEIINKVRRGEYVWYQIKPGDQFDWMMFSEYKMVNGVTAAWTSNEMYAAKMYTVNRADRDYVYYDVLLCGNPTGKIIRKEVKPSQEITKPEIIPTPQPKPEIRKEEKPLLLLVPPKQGEKEKPAGWKLKPDAEISIYGGNYRAVQGTRTSFIYYGYSASIFPEEYSLSGGTFRIGPSVEQTFWQGSIGSDVVFKGQKDLAGIESQYIRGNDKTAFKVREGRKVGSVKIKGTDLRNNEKADMTSLEAIYQHWDLSKKYFSLWEIGWRADLSRNEKKASNIPADGAAVNQSEFGFRVRTDIVQNKHIIPFAEISLGNRQFDKKYVGEATLGAKLVNDTFEPLISYQAVEGPKNDLARAGIVINIHHAWGLIKHLISSPVKEDNKREETEKLNPSTEKKDIKMGNDNSSTFSQQVHAF